jgi:hypothetical protein
VFSVCLFKVLPAMEMQVVSSTASYSRFAAWTLAAWMEFLGFGLPRIPAVPQIYPSNFAGPHGFPFWVRYCHFFNFLFVTILIRSGLSILVDHPTTGEM